MSQTSRGKSQPIILIVNLSVCVFQMRMSASVTEFSEVLPPFFTPPTFSFVRVVSVVVLIVVPKLLLHPPCLPSFSEF